jgi:hypothetical protein
MGKVATLWKKPEEREKDRRKQGEGKLYGENYQRLHYSICVKVEVYE